LLELLVL